MGLGEEEGDNGLGEQQERDVSQGAVSVEQPVRVDDEHAVGKRPHGEQGGQRERWGRRGEGGHGAGGVGGDGVRMGLKAVSWRLCSDTAEYTERNLKFKFGPIQSGHKLSPTSRQQLSCIIEQKRVSVRVWTSYIGALYKALL